MTIPLRQRLAVIVIAGLLLFPEIPAMAISDSDMRRIMQTVRCSDCESIPKVADAGLVRDGVQTMHNGVKVAEDCYYGAWMTELIRRLRGHHEPQEERVFHELLKRVQPGSAMVELGSFWAYYSLWFQQQIAGAKSYMLELDPNNLEVGRKNFDLNGMNGQFFNCAIDSQSRPPAPMRGETGVMQSIPTICVDDFLEQQSIERVDLLLCDTQGFETPMLKGAERSIRRGAIRFAIISTHHHSISGDPLTHQKCLKTVEGYGAKVLAEHSVSESFSGDGLIAAAFDPADRELPNINVSCNRSKDSLFGELEYDLDAARRDITFLKGRTLRGLINRAAVKAKRTFGRGGSTTG